MVRLRILFLHLILVASLRGHVVDQFYAELTEPGPEWTIELLFDVGYAIPEWRGDPDTPQPTREWLLEQPDSEHARFRKESESFLRECLGFHVGEEALEVAYTFPDFEAKPHDFPNLLTGGAYYRVLIAPRDLPAAATTAWTAATDIPDFVLKIRDLEDGEAAFVTLGPGESIELPDMHPATVEPPGRPAIQHALIEGYRHVLPLGLDHVLFILTLFFLKRAGRPLLWQSLTFTAAHTITLGLAASGIIRPDGNWIEPLIALSIAALAIENLFVEEFRPWRYFMIFGFGLIHGMGFANALAPILVAGDDFLPRLLATNLGVELAQVSVLVVAWIATLKWNTSPAYPKFRFAANLAIAATAIFWLVERIS